jgi:hypothetical protein
VEVFREIFQCMIAHVTRSSLRASLHPMRYDLERHPFSQIFTVLGVLSRCLKELNVEAGGGCVVRCM